MENNASKYSALFFYRSCCILIYKERSLGHYASKKFDLILNQTHCLGWVKRLDIEIVQISRFWL